MRSSAPPSASPIRNITSNPATVGQDPFSANSSDPFGWSDSPSSSTSDPFSSWTASSTDPFGVPTSTESGSTHQKGSLLDF
jgi:hypothetical protein